MVSGTSLDDKALNLQLTHSVFVFNDKEQQILTVRDISTQLNLEKEERKNERLHLMTSSASHELLTPIRCIITFAFDLMYKLRKENDLR